MTSTPTQFPSVNITAGKSLNVSLPALERFETGIDSITLYRVTASNPFGAAPNYVDLDATTNIITIKSTTSYHGTYILAIVI